MSLKARLRIAILALVVGIVLSLSVLYLQTTVEETFNDGLDRAHSTAEQVKTFVVERVQERVSASMPGSDLAARKEAWYNAIASDQVLPRLLERTMANSSFVIEIAVLDENGRILTASNPDLIGKRAPTGMRALPQWKQRNLWARLWEVLRTTDDFSVTAPVGVREQKTPVLSIEVLLSSILLRQELIPQLRQLVIISGVSLALSIFLAILVSNLVARSFEQLGSDIEQLTKGEFRRHEPEFLSPELADVQTKLAMLGQEYHGLRQDAQTLKDNIDRMLQRLEEVVLVFDQGGRLQMAGRPAESLLAKPVDQLIGKTYDELFPPWTNLGGVLKEAFRTRTSIHGCPASLERSNLPTAKLLVNVEMAADASSTGTLVTFRDAESRRELESQLSVSQRLASISKLTSGLAHEIKNPLNGIGLHLEICKAKLAANAPNPESELDVVAKELHRLDRVVKTFLEFMRPIEPHFENCDLLELGRTTTELVQPDARARRIDLHFIGEPDKAAVLADRELAIQAIRHVLQNAVEALDSGGRVDVHVVEMFDEYAVMVKDNGPGIPNELHDKIFNLFFTTKPNGSGVGLALAFLILQLHSGTIQFDTEVGKGTTFRLRFPVAGSQAAGTRSRGATRHEAA